MRILFALLTVFTLLSGSASAQGDTVITEDLRPAFRMLSNEGIVPVIELDNFSGRMLFVPVDLRQNSGTLLRIDSEEKISLFQNEQWVGLIDGEKWYSVDSLRDVYGDSVVYTLYHANLNPFLINTGLYQLSELREVVSPISIQTRQSGIVTNVWTFTFFLIIGYLGVLYFFYPRSVLEFFWVTRALSFRELDENLIKTRPMAGVNILFYVLLAAIASWAVCVLMVLSENHLANNYFMFESFWEGLWIWTRMMVIFFVLLILKYVLIWIFKELFKISAFINSHFFNYIRIGLLSFTLIAVLTFISYFTLYIVDPGHFLVLLYALIVMLIIRGLIIFFKLMNGSSHAVLHLFSYLCATELIPLLLIISVGVNQMM